MRDTISEFLRRSSLSFLELVHNNYFGLHEGAIDTWSEVTDETMWATVTATQL